MPRPHDKSQVNSSMQAAWGCMQQEGVLLDSLLDKHFKTLGAMLSSRLDRVDRQLHVVAAATTGSSDAAAAFDASTRSPFEPQQAAVAVREFWDHRQESPDGLQERQGDKSLENDVVERLDDKDDDNVMDLPEASEVEVAEIPRKKNHHSKLGMLLHRQANSNLRALVLGPLDAIVSMIVLLNVVLMVWQIQVAGNFVTALLQDGVSQEYSWTVLDTVFDVCEYVFFGVYLLDLIVRMVVLRRKWLVDSHEGIQFMNLFDAVIVLLNAAEIFVVPLLQNKDVARNASSVKLLKILRVTRAFRLIRTVVIFRQLRVLLTTCVASMGAFFWSIALLMIFQMTYALLLSQALSGFLLDSRQDLELRIWINDRYGDFFKALYTMFEITYSGSWPSHVRLVVERVSPLYSIVFLTYVTFVVFAVVRIITALFIKETLACAANDASIAMEEKRLEAIKSRDRLEDLFDTLDSDGDGMISEDEFLHALSNPIVCSYMDLLEISVKEVSPLFNLLDDGDGLVDINEFCDGISNLKGHARAMDVVAMQHENLKIQHKCNEIASKLDALVDHHGCNLSGAFNTRRSCRVSRVI
eukprot:TRINITY_DN60902_c0_g1_i1.p1 TRINITY_DN60902_c0_g1~~TRINITY_DN60902_c0_g1_i1.p1  ORF type:complete len:583 (+),score=93.52 TRINITY_DN60902_c0_g1_i1:127-1875(+)